MIERLRRGERFWQADLILRSAALAPFGLCTLLWRAVRHLADTSQVGGAIQFVAAAAACVCLSLGLALALEGPGLFRPVPLPPRALI